MRQYWVAPIGPFHTANGTAYNTSTTLTDVSPLPAITVPGNLLEVGTEIELWASGEFSNTATPTLLLGFYYGGVAGVALAASTTITTITAATAWSWQMYYRGVVRTAGATGTINGQGELRMPASLTQFQAPYVIPATAAARTATIDTTAAKSITVGAQWSASSASNTLTVNDISVKIIT